MNKSSMIALAGLTAMLGACSSPIGMVTDTAESVLSVYASALEKTLELHPLADELADVSKEFCPEVLRFGTLMCTTTRGDSVSYWSKGHCVGFEYENEEDDDIIGTYCFHPKGCAQVTIEGENENGDPYKITYELFFTSLSGGTVFETYTCDSDTETGKGTFILR